MSALLAALVLLQAGELGIPQEPVARPGTRYFLHETPVTCAAIPRGGVLLVSLDSTGQLSGWDVSTGSRRYVRPALRPGDPPQRLTCSPDGRFVALSSRTPPASVVVVFELSTGKEFRRLDRCFSPAFSPDGEILAGSDGRSIRRWALKSGAELPGLEESKTDLQWVAFAPDGKNLAATYKGCYGSASWNLETGKIAQAEPSVERPEATALTYTPDGTRTVMTSFWGSWLGGPPLFFANEGRWVVSGWRRKLLQIWELKGDEPIYSVHVPFNSPEFIEVSDGGDLLLRVRGAGIQLERLPTAIGGPPLTGARKTGDPVTGLGFTAQGKVVVAEASGSVLHWDPVFRKEIRRAALPFPGLRRLSNDGLKGILVKELEDPRVWGMKEDLELLRIKGLPGVSAWAFSPDGTSLALGTLAGEISIWDLARGKEQARLRGETAVTALAWSRDGKTIAWGDVRGGVTFVDGRTGREPLRLEPRGSGITALSFLADGRTVASGDRRGRVFLWKDELGKEPDLFVQELDPVGAIELSPDGRWLAVASGRHLRLHALRKDHAPIHLQGHDGHINLIAFSADGTMLMAGGEDPTAILWSAPSGK